MASDRLKEKTGNYPINSQQNQNEFNKMAWKEYGHLATASECKKRVDAIKNASHVTMPCFSFLHNYNRMKYSWYYKWHLRRNSSLIHWVILIISIALIIIINCKNIK